MNEDYTTIKAEISTMHELIRVGIIPAWEGYDPHEHGACHLVDSGIPLDQLYSIVNEEVNERSKKLREML